MSDPFRQAANRQSVPSPSSAKRSLDPRKSRSLHGQRKKRSTKMAFAYQRTRVQMAYKSKMANSKATYITMLAPGSRVSSLLAPSAMAIATPMSSVKQLHGPVWAPNTGIGTTGDHGELYKWAPPKNLDIQRLFRDIELTIAELITFMPLHRSWPAFMIRCYEGGWECSDIAKLIVYSRKPYEAEPLPVQAFLKNDLRRSFHLALKTGLAQATTNGHLINGTLNGGDFDFTTSNWHYPANRHGYSALFDEYDLLQFANKVHRFPKGQGKGILTMAIENAKAKCHRVRVRDLARYAAKEGLTAQPLSSHPPLINFPTLQVQRSLRASKDKEVRDKFVDFFNNLN